MEGNQRWFGRAVLLTILAVIILCFRSAGLITDFWWFDALGFKDIFLISLKTKLWIFFISAAIFYVFARLNLWVSSRFHARQDSWLSGKRRELIVISLSLLIGWAMSYNWFTWLQYFNQVPFNLADPIFMKDVAFYVFSLPFLLGVLGYVQFIAVLTTILVAVDYFQPVILGFFDQSKLSMMKDPNTGLPLHKTIISSSFKTLKKNALRHVTVLGSLIFLLISGKHYFTRYSIMYSEKGIVVGAGYTDVNIFLPIVKMLMVFAFLIVVLFYIWMFYISKEPKLKKRHIVATILGIYFIFAFLGPGIIPGIVQSLKVSPNELNLERPFIENNIKFTKIAYGLDDVTETDFPSEGKITAELLENSTETMNNVRLLDWRPLVQTYKQTQEIRLYYELADIDIDRYMINGSYTEVMLSPRELDQRQIVSNAQTWVNLHLVYTHGFGVVVSPVNSVTAEGLPDYLLKDIPPKNVMDESVLDIDKPQIYYGEVDNDFVVVNTKTEEFDFPKGTTNEYINYDGKGGVVLDTFMKKFFMALRFKDVKILLTADITPSSRLMFIRSIRERISKLTPFLLLDNDPYIVIDDGKLLWIQDAYTVTGNFPYSQKAGDINYMRNSVKIVVDAYDGTVTYYVTDVNDPIMETYARIFPKQFSHIKSMPSSLRAHVRYPEDLFTVQSALYSIYHMENPTVFYNKEDAWQIPTEIYGTGEQVRVEPYYIIMKLPGEEKEEFVLMSPFTPLKKDNMIAWFAARSDGEQYGKLLLYKFPKDKLIYGPLQIEAKFDQDSEISQQLTLWSQQGSSVTRGNLLVIPIDDSLLYIEPLYLQADKGKLPQLKRVLVSDGERVVMEESLGEALEALFGTTRESRRTGEGDAARKDRLDVTTDANLVEEANLYYTKVLKSMEEQDWAGMGENFGLLGEVLYDMSSVDDSSG
ncbi:MAG: UPF0182 family protein, partial [Candidatus Woesearchaeota archaeon]